MIATSTKKILINLLTAQGFQNQASIVAYTAPKGPVRQSFILTGGDYQEAGKYFYFINRKIVLLLAVIFKTNDEVNS